MSPITHLTGEVAIDVARMTGVTWSWERMESRGPRVPVIDLSRLSYVDRMKVAWSVIGAYHYLSCHSD